MRVGAQAEGDSAHRKETSRRRAGDDKRGTDLRRQGPERADVRAQSPAARPCGRQGNGEAAPNGAAAQDDDRKSVATPSLASGSEGEEREEGEVGDAPAVAEVAKGEGGAPQAEGKATSGGQSVHAGGCEDTRARTPEGA